MKRLLLLKYNVIHVLWPAVCLVAEAKIQDSELCLLYSRHKLTLAKSLTFQCARSMVFVLTSKNLKTTSQYLLSSRLGSIVYIQQTEFQKMGIPILPWYLLLRQKLALRQHHSYRSLPTYSAFFTHFHTAAVLRQQKSWAALAERYEANRGFLKHI